MVVEGAYTDGDSARRYDVTITIEPPYLTLRGDGLKTIRWRLNNVRLEGVSEDHLRILRTDGDGQVSVPEPGSFRDRLKQRIPSSWHRRLWEWPGSPLRFMMVLIVSVSLMVGLVVALGAFAERLAHAIPPSWVAPVGHSLKHQLAGEDVICNDPGAERILSRLSNRLYDREGSVDVAVVDRSEPNAVTLPGGTILVFRGFLDYAEEREELTGVLAHEIAHAIHRDPTAAMIRGVGYQVLWGWVAGEHGGIFRQITARSYSRGQERRADHTALRLLHREELSSTGLVTFFRRLSDRRGDAVDLTWLSTHPAPGDRINYLKHRNRRLEPGLTIDEWEQLQTMCEE